MDELLYEFVRNATTVQKGVFLMIAGVCFVFVVQLVFYMVVKLWPKPRADN